MYKINKKALVKENSYTKKALWGNKWPRGYSLLAGKVKVRRKHGKKRPLKAGHKEEDV